MKTDRIEGNLVIQGATRDAISSVTINNLPEDIDLQITAIIQQDNFYTHFFGDIPKTVAPKMIKKPFLKRLFSREKYYYFKQPRYYTIHSPNGLPFNCQWAVYKATQPTQKPSANQ